ncbi:hypothetical protein G4B88_001212 [Cannabis sativa]|uniref:Alpha-carbonic anhydrase domain-containing protein n=1 Tax=Cannabis sativa TaxID=3483 RepID=A0A7J6ED13_CANSA|nr:hypothetical protein G4B88_001212 [Cannabis sativa]
MHHCVSSPMLPEHNDAVHHTACVPDQNTTEAPDPNTTEVTPANSIPATSIPHTGVINNTPASTAGADFLSGNNESTFSYNEGSSKGPKKWGQIDSHWKICNNGKLQSPIDLLHQKVQDFPNLEIIKFGSKEYYRYIGSLTIPPCTEGVIWTIFRKVRTVSREQGFEVNARPTQQLNGRPVWMYTPRGGN